MKNKNKIKNKNVFIKLTALYFVLVLGGCGLYFVSEPGLSKAATDSDVVTVNLTVSGTISLSSPADVTMSPAITGTGSSTGTAQWTVTTNNSAGYKLEVEASASPAMVSGSDTFADYTEGVAGTPETWSVAAADSEFGFTASGTDAESKYNTDLYEGFSGATKIQVASANAETTGTATTVGFKAEVGASKSQPTGSYSATITATATTL